MALNQAQLDKIHLFRPCFEGWEFLQSVKDLPTEEALALADDEELVWLARMISDSSFNDLVDPAWKDYNKVFEPAHKAYEEALTQAWIVYNAAVEDPRRVYDGAQASDEASYLQAMRRYHEVSVAALKVYEESVRPAREAYTAVFNTARPVLAQARREAAISIILNWL